MLANKQIFAQSTAVTSYIRVQAAEKIFIQNNLSLLAAKYNIDVNKALLRQAKLWDNSVLNTDQNIYEAQGKFLSHNNTNEQLFVQAKHRYRWQF